MIIIYKYPYTQPEFDAFGWSPLSRSSIPHGESHGLDYDSAREATPRWYGVSSGNGNDGVSHTFPDYYVRTNDPFRLAELAAIGMLNHKYRSWAKDNVEVDGEADYTISATFIEGPNEETEFGMAWLIVEVFPIDQPGSSTPQYDNIDECFDDLLVALVPSE